jgi:uncharacterized membrane protein YfcA
LVAIDRTVWRSYLPALILLGVLAAAAVVVFSTGAGDQVVETPQVAIGSGALLVLIGIVAGVLGGLIGTGGCSVMLPAIHF